jgi:hypothetical protein
MDKIKELYNDPHMRDAVEALILDVVDEEVVSQVRAGNQEVRVNPYEILPKAWDKLELMFGEKPKPKTTNQAR